MSDKQILSLDGVAETLLIPLYIRAMETQRPDALLKDNTAVTLVKRLDYDFSRLTQLKLDEDDKLAIILRNREFDRYVQGFLARHPQAVVVHIGCGLDSRFERVDNGQVEWVDLDLPEVIELRRRLIGGEGERHHFLAYSAFDSAWLNTVMVHHPRPFLFLAEGVLLYFKKAQVKSLVLMLQKHFPGAELVFEACPPIHIWMNNLRMSLTKFGARTYWGLKRGKELESWADGIRFLDEWFLFDSSEPRLAHIRWMRHVPILSKILGIYHYRLGQPAHLIGSPIPVPPP